MQASEPKGGCSSVTDLSSQRRDSHSHCQWQSNFSLFFPSCFKTTFEVALFCFGFVLSEISLTFSWLNGPV